MRPRSWEKLRHVGFDRAIRTNVVKEPSWRARLNNSFVKFAMSQRVPVLAEIPHKLIYQKPEQNPRTQKYWESTRGLLTAPAGVNPWIVELARIAVADGYVGILKSFEQVVTVEEQEVCLSESENWGNPFLIPDELTFTWYFRLERSGTGEPPWINIASPTPLVYLPGEPHFDLQEIYGLWYPAASPPSQNFHLTIGGRYRLRVLCVVARTDTTPFAVSAKIRGFSLSAYDKDTQHTIRSLW